jgi:pantothenate kinase
VTGSATSQVSSAGRVSSADRASDPPVELPFDARHLADRARALRRDAGRRILLGITGPPGAGKSTISAELLAELGNSAVTVPMDGFHYSNAVLRSLGRESRKGAPDTFDVGGYVALLDRLRAAGAELRGTEGDGVETRDAETREAQTRDAQTREAQSREAQTIYGPSFDRRLDEPIANDIAIPASAEIVLTEGNYLLTPLDGWREVRARLDEVWYVDVDHSLRLARLTARHGAFGKTPDAAERWANGPDETNARLVTQSRHRADLIVRLDG